jgi:ABC-type glycerol-3-phosphate transport system permease component
MPALAVVGVYSLLLAWNEYLYQAVLLSLGTKHDRFGDAGPVVR